MAPESYYFLLSMTAVLASVMLTAGMAYYRVKGKTILGDKFKSGTIEYESMRKYSSNRALIILGAITLLCIVNLIYNVYRLLHLEDQEYVRFALIFAPALVAILFVGVAVGTLKKHGDGNLKNESRNRNKDDDSWLS